jgi:hypothetical protein
MNSFRFEMDLELKIWEANSNLGFRKFNKIARGGLKILEFAWR